MCCLERCIDVDEDVNELVLEYLTGMVVKAFNLDDIESLCDLLKTNISNDSKLSRSDNA